jgi:hypothetical protein
MSLRPWINKLLNRNGQRPGLSASCVAQSRWRFRPRLEALEDRTLLSADLSVMLTGPATLTAGKTALPREVGRP